MIVSSLINNYRETSNISRILEGNKILVTLLQLEHRLSELLQLINSTYQLTDWRTLSLNQSINQLINQSINNKETDSD